MKTRFQAQVPWILGLDLGSNSVGWAAMRLKPGEAGDPEKATVEGFLTTADEFATRPCMGSRIFEIAVENYGKGKGKEESLNKKRRLMRQQRRMAERRARRQRKTFNLLVRLGLLPAWTAADHIASNKATEAARDLVLKRLDVELLAGLAAKADAAVVERAGYHLPYILRARALDSALTPHEFGRALYHLAQRRGYQSNRKAKGEDEKVDDAADEGEAGKKGKAKAKKATGAVEGGISALQGEMEARGSRTLGEHFASIEPGTLRIRKRWTARGMYKAEFELVVDAQARLGGTKLSDADRKSLKYAIFHQRPLKSCRELIGKCSYENGGEWTRQAHWPHLGAVESLVPIMQRTLGKLCWCGKENWAAGGLFEHKHTVVRRRRAAQFFLDCQRFLVLDKVNNLAFQAEGRVLTTELGRYQIDRVLDAFGEDEEVTNAMKVTKVTKVLGLKEGSTLQLGGKAAKGALTREQIPELKVLRRDFDKPQDLTKEQKQLLAAELERQGSMSMSAAKKALGLDPSGRFNIEAGGDIKLHGNRTNAAFIAIFGDCWNELSAAEKHEAVLDVWRLEDDALVKRATDQKGVWKALRTSTVDARKLLKIPMSSDYIALSRTAVRKLLPLMEQGLCQADAKLAVYGTPVASDLADLLPPVHEAIGDLKNPVVVRALTEMRRVVNSLVRLYGRPAFVRVELARDIKKNADQRREDKDRMRENEAERDQAAQRVCTALGTATATRADIEKVRLWDECGGVCPYTGESIGFKRLLAGDVDVEHILPFSLSQDDSFANKTLCISHFNRNVKAQQTPYQALVSSKDDWEKAKQRMRMQVERQVMSYRKYQRFCLTDAELTGPDGFIDSFRSQQLNDTKYASRMAIRYLARLYGGRLEQGTDAAGVKRVQASTGQVTAALRSRMSMPIALGKGQKTRDDHRHHAIDAVAVAMAGPAELNRLSAAAGKSWAEFHKVSYHLDLPWQMFTNELTANVAAIVVSHRVSNPVRGALHQETIYSPPRSEAGARVAADAEGERWHHVRKPVNELSAADVDDIVDPVVRELVRAKLNGGHPEKVFNPEDPSTLPAMPSKRHPDGGIPIRRVRLHFKASLHRFAKAPHRERWMANSENHHAVFHEITDARGRIKWVGECVPGFEAMRRRMAGEPIVNRSDAPGKRFLFSLCKRDVVEVEHKGVRRAVVIAGLSPTKSSLDIEGRTPTDARATAGKNRSERIRLSPGSLWKGVATKLAIDPLGRVRASNA